MLILLQHLVYDLVRKYIEQDSDLLLMPIPVKPASSVHSSKKY